MQEQYIIEIEKRDQMIHQGKIFDQCSIGGNENHFYQSRDLKNNELLIREIGGVYNIIANSKNWILNGKKLPEKKYHILGSKNKLICGKYTIKIKKIRDKATGGLELESQKKDLHELIGESSSKKSNDIDIYNTTTTTLSTNKIKNLNYIKKIGIFANISSKIFSLSIFYILGWFIIPMIKSSSFNTYLMRFNDFVINNLSKISPKFVLNNQMSVFQNMASGSQQINDMAKVADNLSLQLIQTFILFVLIKILLSTIFGRPVNYLFLGVNVDSNFFIKRIKSPLYEVLGFIFLPLNIYNVGGLLPIRSIHALILKFSIYRSSTILGLLGPIIISIFSALILTLPFLFSTFENESKINIEKFSTRVKGNLITNKLVFNDINIEIPEFKEMVITKKISGEITQYKIKSKKIVKGIIIKAKPKPFLSWKLNTAQGNPMAFITHPINALENINLPIPKGNAIEFKRERIDMVNQVLFIGIENLIEKLLYFGPFLSGAYFLNQELKYQLQNYQFPLKGYWINSNGGMLLLAGKRNALITLPTSTDNFQIELFAKSTKELDIFVRKFLMIKKPLDIQNINNSLINKIFLLFNKIELDSIPSNIDDLSKIFNFSPVKNMQNSQKELTNSIKEATKAKSRELEKADKN